MISEDNDLGERQARGVGGDVSYCRNSPPHTFNGMSDLTEGASHNRTVEGI